MRKTRRRLAALASPAGDFWHAEPLRTPRKKGYAQSPAVRYASSPQEFLGGAKMNPSLKNLSMVLGVIGSGCLLCATAARAETPYERDQRQMLEQYQQQHGLSPQVQQAQRWQQEWKQQHPNEPMPSFGALEKLHRSEIIANTNEGFAKGRAARQAELQHNYELSRQNQARMLAAQGITWSKQQWDAWNKQYDLAMRQQANDYLKAVAQAGEMSRTEMAREEDARIRASRN
jgi:hypothetical protein